MLPLLLLLLFNKLIVDDCQEMYLHNTSRQSPEGPTSVGDAQGAAHHGIVIEEEWGR